MVTGGLGLNGTWSAWALAAAGHEVTLVDTREDDPLATRLVPGAPRLVGDIADDGFLASVCHGARIDVIVHMAAITNKASKADPRSAVEVNVIGTDSVLRAATTTGVRRVVFASSGSVYAPFVGRFGHPTYEPVDEAFEASPQPFFRIYGWTKLLCEQLGFHYAQEHGLEFVALRFSDIMAPGRSVRRATTAAVPPFERLIDAAIAGRPVSIERGGDQKDDILYVKDLAAAVALAVAAQHVENGVYNVGSGAVASLRDVADSIRSVIPDAELAVGPGLDFHGRGPVYGRFDIAKARAHLGYAPRYDIARAVADFIAFERSGIDAGPAPGA